MLGAVDASPAPCETPDGTGDCLASLSVVLLLAALELRDGTEAAFFGGEGGSQGSGG